jgi:hypothetical protein
MTIKEFVLKQEKNLGINDWIKLIERNNMGKLEKTIINCADSLGLIKVDYTASFMKAIKKSKK